MSLATWQERDFEEWFRTNARLPGGEQVLLVRRQRAVGRMVDLLALDEQGGLVFLEIKNERCTRRAVAQAVEYLSQYAEATIDEVTDEYEEHIGEAFAT